MLGRLSPSLAAAGVQVLDDSRCEYQLEDQDEQLRYRDMYYYLEEKAAINEQRSKDYEKLYVDQLVQSIELGKQKANLELRVKRMGNLRKFMSAHSIGIMCLLLAIGIVIGGALSLGLS